MLKRIVFELYGMLFLLKVIVFLLKDIVLDIKI